MQPAKRCMEEAERRGEQSWQDSPGRAERKRWGSPGRRAFPYAGSGPPRLALAPRCHGAGGGSGRADLGYGEMVAAAGGVMRWWLRRWPRMPAHRRTGNEFWWLDPFSSSNQDLKFFCPD